MQTQNEASRLLEQMLDNSSELVFAQDEKGRIVYVNKTLSEFLGVNSGESAFDECKVRFADVVNDNTGQQLNSPEEPDGDERSILSMKNAAGGIRQLRSNSKCLTLENDRRFYIGSYTDITSLVAARSNLQHKTRKLVEKNKAMDALNTVAVELIERLDFQSLLTHVVNNAGKITGADYSFVAMVDESNEHLCLTAASAEPADMFAKKLKRGDGLGGEVWRTGKALIVNDYQNHSVKKQGLEIVRQAGAVPIKIANEVVGVFGAIYEDIEPKIDDQVDLLEKFAQLVAVAIENTNLHEYTRSELIRTEALNEITFEINSSTDFKLLLDKVCRNILNAFGASRAHVYQCENGGDMSPLVAWKMCNSEIVAAADAEPGVACDAMANWCIKNQQTAFVKRGEVHAGESRDAHQRRKALNLGSSVCVPLVHQNVSWGVLLIHRQMNQSDFSRSDINLLKTIGGHASIALHRHDLLNRVQHQADHDSLTGLPNRFMFDKVLSDAINSRAGTTHRLAVLYMDLDGFKLVNDSHGHATGDLLLQKVASRLVHTLKHRHTLSRMGGDEFAVMFCDYESHNEVVFAAKELLDCLIPEFCLGDIRIQLSASAGISFYPDDADDASGLLKNSDVAMYNAKELGKKQVSTFSHEDAERFKNRLQMEADLREAYSQQQFELYLQPKVSCSGDYCDSVEALIRWQHPGHGFVSPAEFIPLAEEIGLIQSIGNWVIDEACRIGAEFSSNGRKIRIAVNISAQQFAREDFVDTVFALIEKNGFSPRLLELEVTESVVMRDMDMVVQRLEKLRQAGVGIAIDDFGTGYSSLKYLEILPVDVLKIDKAFVDNLAATNSMKSVVKTIILMAKTFNLFTVAEGVETEVQVNLLKELGCDYIQGYFYSKPLPASQLLEKIDYINHSAAVDQLAGQITRPVAVMRAN